MHANIVSLIMTACVIKNTGLQVRITEACMSPLCSVTLSQPAFVTFTVR